MNRGTYSFLLKLFSPLVLLWFSRRARKAGGQWDIRSPERFGRYDQSSADSGVTQALPESERPVWIHAVSLGETIAAQPLVRHLIDEGYTVLLTNMTATGRAQAAKFFAAEIQRGRLLQAWVPYDLTSAVRGFFDKWQPRCGILIEREVWANLIHEARQRNIPMLLVSARFSERALRQTLKLGTVLREAMESLDLVLAQTHNDAMRLENFKLKDLQVCGNLKFDVSITKEQIVQGQQIRKRVSRPIVVISSTREGEEQQFVDALLEPEIQRLTKKNNTLYLIVPRHPERFREVERIIQNADLRYVKRSDNPEPEALMGVDVCLGDSLGEMFMYYAVSDIAIVAGGFVNLGGQNHIEASALGVPVIVGPYTRNFEQAVEDAIVEGAARRTDNPEQALRLAEGLVENPDTAQAMSKAAHQWLSLHNGVTTRIYEAIRPYL